MGRASGVPKPLLRDQWTTGSRHRNADQERHARLNQHLRQTFIEGAEEDSRRRLGRGLTAEELERVLWHYPGDVLEPGSA